MAKKTAAASPNAIFTTKDVMACLRDIFQAELAASIRHLHYAFMIMGHNRIPIQKWFRDQAQETTADAILIGEKITSFDGHPPVISARIEETNQHGVHALLEESLRYEEATLGLYKKLLNLAGDDIALEELARDMVRQETEHCGEVRKMLKSH